MSWFRSLQGQLTELANEVLNEATDEVADPESELQVVNKKLSETERLLIAEQSKVKQLEERLHEQEQLLSASHAEMDMIAERHRTMILTRDDEIKKLKTELERLQLNTWHGSDVDSGTVEQTIMDLQREVSHWKSLVESESKKASTKKLEECLEEERRKREAEIASLVESHSRSMNEMKEMYEERIIALEGVASSSTSNTDLLDAVLLEKEELLETKRKLEGMVRQRESACPSTTNASATSNMCDDRLEVLDLVERSDVTDLEEKLRDTTAELTQLRATYSEMESKFSEYENLKIQHEELTQAYNDLNEEFEKYKETTTANAQDNNNQDLTRRIDLLKANLIEYEERYEMCKRENLETVAQLERLTGEFERLKTGFADVREQKDSNVTGELSRLQAALEQAKQDRDRLRADVDKFRSTIEGIDVELDTLRASNRRLCQENEELAAVIDDYTKALNNSGKEGANTNDGRCEKVEDCSLQSSLAEVRSAAVDDLHRQLREEVALLHERDRLFSEESRLLAEVNSQLKKQAETDSKKVQLLEEKIALLEEHIKTSLCKHQKEDSIERNQSTASHPSNDEVLVLTEQLREALAANAEKTEECEKLRQQADDLEKEVTVRQSCVDEMIAQTNVLQVQLQIAAETNMQLKQQILEKDRSLNLFNEKLSQKKPESIETASHGEQVLEVCDQSMPDCSGEQIHDSTSSRADNVQSSVNEHDVERVKVLTEYSERLELECSQLKQASLQSDELIKEKAKIVETLTLENEQLRQLATQKHAESVDYFGRLETAVERIAFLEKKLTEKDGCVAESLKEEREAREKCSRELQRLREHLMLVEETSTSEAVEAEKRETELREQIRQLQNSIIAADTDSAKTAQSMKSELTSLQERVTVAEESAADWKCRYEGEKRLHWETSDALVVVRELSADHEREAADASHRNVQLQEKIRELTGTVESLRADMERLSLDKQTVEDLLESAKNSITARQKIVEDLEVQLEEARASSRKSSESYHIDDVTLRQLFLSYFTAPADKRPDIALLLASVLQYPPEDMQKVRQAVSGTTRNSTTSGGISLAEQFIRFLENESESATTAPHLPVAPRELTPGPSLVPPQITLAPSQPSSLDAMLK
ncbi:hypothetical protein KIN20_005017 [Parelaphostrongylus tenuis]|uniref:GRIP domain-containing protein n=1 Tax=Parelaphostrongylus tenuis TaxID=148309 RepID=A0AAD5MKQ6_PARTN|nr:hypothetical protein KIN20_005017 [Parelaphostrongylus tenuis]